MEECALFTLRCAWPGWGFEHGMPERSAHEANLLSGISFCGWKCLRLPDVSVELEGGCAGICGHGRIVVVSCSFAERA
jgi:hypothetical protein